MLKNSLFGINFAFPLTLQAQEFIPYIKPVTHIFTLQLKINRTEDKVYLKPELYFFGPTILIKKIFQSP